MPEGVGLYQFERRLGQGGTARVYLARHTQSGRLAAIKVFHPGLWDHEDYRKRALTEFRTVSSLEHPNIVKVIEALFDQDPPAVAMEYVEGHSLEEFQARLPYVLPEVSVLLVTEILRALEHAHAQGVIHRDLKPANILVRTDGAIFVSDFGHAKLADNSRITLTGTILGSPDFMAPEQAQGDRATARSDVFAVSSLLYFLVTGTKPFTRHSPLATLAAVISAETEPAHRRNPKLSPGLSKIIARGLSKDPAARFAGAREFREALEGYLGELGLAPDLLNFRGWMAAPHEFSMRALQTIAENLVFACEALAASGRTEEALEKLSHLSIVAPESPHLATLALKLNEAQARARDAARRQRLRRPAIVLLLLLLMGVGSYFAMRRNSPSSAVPVVASSTDAASAPETRPARVAPPSRPQATKTHTVRFELPKDVRVFWNGREVDASRPLQEPRAGLHKLRLEKAGLPPIQQTIQVKAGEPTLIRAR